MVRTVHIPLSSTEPGQEWHCSPFFEIAWGGESSVELRCCESALSPVTSCHCSQRACKHLTLKPHKQKGSKAGQGTDFLSTWELQQAELDLHRPHMKSRFRSPNHRRNHHYGQQPQTCSSLKHAPKICPIEHKGNVSFVTGLFGKEHGHLLVSAWRARTKARKRARTRGESDTNMCKTDQPTPTVEGGQDLLRQEQQSTCTSHQPWSGT